MTKQTKKPDHIPANHIDPTDEQIAAQIQREEDASAMGKIRAQQKLQKQKEGMDYSRSQGGTFLMDRCINMSAACIKQGMADSINRAGTQSALVGPAYKRLTDTTIVNLPKFNSDGELETKLNEETGEEELVLVRQSDKTINLWDHDEIAFIVLLTLIDTCRMPILGSIEKQSRSGKRFGTRPDVYKLVGIISDRINDHLAHKYIRECTKGTGKDGLIDFILKDSYSHSASWAQKKTNTRLKRKEKVQEFLANDLAPVADVLGWRPFSGREGRALVHKLISKVEMGCELALEFAVFKTVDRSQAQFYGLTEPALEFVDGLDQARIGRSFLPDVMVCPPRLHTQRKAGGYLGVAQSLIKRSFTGGFKGEFRPSDAHLRFINGMQAVPYRINPVVLELLNRLNAQPHQDWREQGHFIPAPFRDHYLKLPKLGPAPEFMTDEQRVKRKKDRKAIKAEWSAYMQKKKESEGSLTVDTLDLANRVADLERFWLPVVGDFRGRGYCANHLLNSQGMDYQRALLQFANGKKEDSRTRHHIELAIAGYAGQDKRTYEQRIRWFEDHKDVIMADLKDWDTITSPSAFWRTLKTMDDAFAFFACAMEWKRLYLDKDPDRTTYLIVHRDATASGGQLISGLTHSGETAQAVNLVPGSKGVFDIYVAVLDVMKEQIRDLNYRVPLLTQNLEPKTDPNGNVEYMSDSRVRYLFRKDDEAKGSVRKGIKGGFLPRLYGAGLGKTVAGMREKFKFVHLSGKQKKLTIHEARALAPFFEAGLNAVMPALNTYVNWAREVANLALRVEVESLTADGKPTKRKKYKALTDENGDPVLELQCPTPNGSTMIQRYPITKAKPLKVDHLTSYSKFDPRIKYREDQLQVATSEVSHKDIQKASPPNIIHSADACVFAFMVDGFDGNYSLIHDSCGASPGEELDQLIERFWDGFCEVVNSGYLEKILEANGVDPLDNPVPNYRTYTASKDHRPDYPIC